MALQGAATLSAAAGKDWDTIAEDWPERLSVLLLASAKARSVGKHLIVGGPPPPGDCWMTIPADMLDGIPSNVRTVSSATSPCGPMLEWAFMV